MLSQTKQGILLHIGKVHVGEHNVVKSYQMCIKPVSSHNNLLSYRLESKPCFTLFHSLMVEWPRMGSLVWMYLL